jgi:hypothetical protein
MGLEAQEVAVRLRLLGGTAFQAEADRSAESLKGITKASEEVNAAGAKGGGLTGFLGGASKSLDTVSGKLDKFSKKSLQVGRETALMSAGASALIYLSTKEYADTERQFKLLETQAHATKAQRKELEATVPSFAKYAIGPKELAEAYYPAQSVFHNIKKDVGSVQAASEGAAIGLDKLPNTINALTAAFKTGFKDVHGYKEEMALLDETVGAGRMHLPELTGVFHGSLFPTAASLNIPQRDILANLAAATQSGQEPEEYGTRFRTALTKMIGLKGEALLNAKKLGFTKNQMAEEMQHAGGLNHILQQLNADRGAQGSEQEIKANREISAVFGGSRSAGTIFTALKTLKANEEILKRLEGVRGGSTLDTHLKQTEESNVGFQFEKLKATFKDLNYEMGKFFAPFVLKGLDDVAKGAKGLVTGFHGLPGPLKDAVGIFIALAAVTAPIAFIMAGAAAGLRLLLFPTKLVLTAVQMLIGEGGFAGLAGAVGEFMGPIGILVGAYVVLETINRLLGNQHSIVEELISGYKEAGTQFEVWYHDVFGGHTKAENAQKAKEQHEQHTFLKKVHAHDRKAQHHFAVTHRHPWANQIHNPAQRQAAERAEGNARSTARLAEQIAHKIKLDITLNHTTNLDGKQLTKTVEKVQRERQNRR